MKPVSQTSIAKELGISQRTVSRALSGKGYVNKLLKQKILDTAEQAGYRKNKLARALIDGKTGVIGLLLQPAGNQHELQLLHHLERLLSAQGYNILLSYSKPDCLDDQQEIARLLHYHVEGLICMPHVFDSTQQSVYSKLAKQYRKIVFLRQEPCCPEIAAAVTDDFKATYTMVRYFLEQGHRHIVYVDDMPSTEHSNGRIATTIQSQQAGFNRAMSDNNLSLQYSINYCQLEGTTQEKVKQFIRICPQVSAFCCSHDLTALTVINTLNGLSYKVPEHFSVSGIGNEIPHDVVKSLKPALTTIDFNAEKLAETAVELLLKMLNGSPAETARVPGKFIIRTSIRPR